MKSYEVIKAGRVMIPSKPLEGSLPKDNNPRWSKKYIEFFWQYDYNAECVRWILSVNPIKRTKENEVIMRDNEKDIMIMSNRDQYPICLSLLKTWDKKDALVHMRSEVKMVGKISRMILDLRAKNKDVKYIYD
jgi:hypothetical protein